MSDIILLHGQQMVREGLHDFLGASGLNIIASTGDIPHAASLLKAHHDVVFLTDVLIGQQRTFDLFGLSNHPVVFSQSDNPTHMACAIAWGAKEYLLASMDRHAIAMRLLAALQGGVEPGSEYLHVRDILQSQEKIPVSPFNLLTRRQCQVLRCLAYGLSNLEISHVCACGIETVKDHVQNILQKLGATDRTMVAVQYVGKVELANK